MVLRYEIGKRLSERMAFCCLDQGFLFSVSDLLNMLLVLKKS